MDNNEPADIILLYDEDNVIAEYGGNDNVLFTLYLTPELDQNLSVSSVDTTDQTSFYYSQDVLNSTRTTTDQNGAIKSYYDYTAYGERLRVITGDDQRYSFTGREMNNNSIHYRYREYFTSLGRFGSRDPVGYHFNQDGNLYKYVDNMPAQSGDPYGLDKWITDMNNGKNNLYKCCDKLPCSDDRLECRDEANSVMDAYATQLRKLLDNSLLADCGIKGWLANFGSSPNSGIGCLNIMNTVHNSLPRTNFIEVSGYHAWGTHAFNVIRVVNRDSNVIHPPPILCEYATTGWETHTPSITEFSKYPWYAINENNLVIMKHPKRPEDKK